ncbi:DUF5665 domain-containing protein [Dethiobacter alkaliphilus]|uniref:DUF5665 domain-containing protein n=1 Tax=Dethiobacter alkaliphilus TaxID=427926 RepID=UPI00222776A0|nr:DUF5665 domain-containing protein [Dethiobacter alkaliphilus]MCW3491207.1 DUF5665 domain-containing protein [Dethiobacter alkaliphilus]
MDGPSRHDEFLLNRLNQRVSRMLQEIDKFNIAEYMLLLNNPRRFFWVNFLGGVGRGVGAALGATVVAAIIIFVMQRMVVLNLPIIGDYIAEIVKIVQNQL